jgi:hypothetical protein
MIDALFQIIEVVRFEDVRRLKQRSLHDASAPR